VKLVKNFLSLAGAEIISKLVTFAAFAYLARVMGPEGFGYVEFAGTLLLCAALIVEQGFSPYGAREIAKDPRKTAALVAQIVLARFILATGAYAAMLAIAVFVGPAPLASRLIMIYGLSLLVTPLLLQWVFQGHDSMQTVAVVQVIRQTVFAAIVFAFVRGTSQIHLVAVAEVAGVCLAAAYCVLMYRRRFGSIFEGRFRLSQRLFREGGTIGLSQVFWMVRLYGATLVFGVIASAEDMGFFAGAMRIVVASHTFIWLYYFNLLPSLSRAWQQEDGAFAGLIARSLHGVAWITAAGALVWVLVSPLVIIGVYGQAFEPAGTTLQWLGGVLLFAGLSGHHRFGLIAAGRQVAEMATAALGAVIAVCGIPVGYELAGSKGAAIALFAAEAVVALSAWWCGRHILGLKGHLKLLSRPTLALAISAAFLWLLALQPRSVNALISIAAMAGLACTLDVKVRERIRQLTVKNAIGLRQWLNKDVPETTR
jgi:PST family polysaccharide transporter